MLTREEINSLFVKEDSQTNIHQVLNNNSIYSIYFNKLNVKLLFEECADMIYIDK